MANFYSQGRTNYFTVTDGESFETAVHNMNEGASSPIELHRSDNTYCLLFPEGVPSWVYNEDTGEDYQFEMEDFIRGYLADGSVCIITETGAENMRYLSGWSVAFNNKGERKAVSLDDIYEGLGSLGDFTRCEY